MKTTIIYAHPWEGSYNHAILDRLIHRLQQEKICYQVIDLNKDQFDPVFSKENLILYSAGETKDESVKHYQKLLLETNELFIISPIWWYEFPAILKGFFDKVMLKEFAYNETNIGLSGLLTTVKKTTIITTSTSPKWYLRFVKGNYVEKIFIKGVLKDLGIKNVSWRHLGNIKKLSEEKRKVFLEKI